MIINEILYLVCILLKLFNSFLFNHKALGAVNPGITTFPPIDLKSGSVSSKYFASSKIKDKEILKEEIKVIIENLNLRTF